MKFELLYFIAKLRGFLRFKRRIELYRLVKYSKEEVREICKELDFLYPYRIVKCTVKFKRRKQQNEKS